MNAQATGADVQGGTETKQGGSPDKAIRTAAIVGTRILGNNAGQNSADAFYCRQ